MNYARGWAQELAQEDFDAMTEDARDYIVSNAEDYILGLIAGPDIAAERLRNIERDCVAYLAENMDESRIMDALEGDTEDDR